MKVPQSLEELYHLFYWTLVEFKTSWERNEIAICTLKQVPFFMHLKVWLTRIKHFQWCHFSNLTRDRTGERICVCVIMVSSEEIRKMWPVSTTGGDKDVFSWYREICKYLPIIMVLKFVSIPISIGMEPVNWFLSINLKIAC